MSKPSHPAFKRMEKRRPDGSIGAISTEEQWQLVEDWHSFLSSEQAAGYPVLDGLNEAWKELEPLYQHEGRPLIGRGPDAPPVSDAPLSALFFFIEMGFYPPPELLLTLADCWSVYESSRGAVSLEEAFLGRPRKGAGNYARQKYSSLRQHCLEFEFQQLLNEGKSRTEAAEALAGKLGGKPDADSILRMMRGIKGWTVVAEQAEK